MSRLKQIEDQIESLSFEERAQLRDWILNQDWKDWDAQIARDVAAGKFDELMTAALDDLQTGRTRDL